jgi:hypothetical protein
MISAVWKYRLGPFLLVSEIALPELEPRITDPACEPEASSADVVRILIARVPERIAGVVANESRWWASHTEYLQRVPGVANFLVRHAREILVEPAENAQNEEIRAYLLSPVFSALCHQAGMYALHGSAVRVGDGVVAFLGNTRAGKSTLAAGLAQRGYSVIADDICLLDARAQSSEVDAETASANSGPALVIPVAPALKLWRSALDHLGTSTESLDRVVRNDDKFRLKLSATAALPPRLPLRQIFFLEWTAEGEAESDSDAQPTIVSVDGVEAITLLMEFTHFDYVMKATGRQTGNFLLCGRILSEACAYRLCRPRNFYLLEQTLDAIESHLGTISKLRVKR